MTLLAERTGYSAPFAKSQRRTILISGPKSAVFEHRGDGLNRSLSHALAQLGSVVGASAETLAHLKWVLSRTLEDDMAYATLSSDGDGGALAQWRAGRSYIALEIGLREHSFTYSTLDGRLAVNTTTLDCDEIREAIRAFTRNLEAISPDWRARRKANGR